MKANYQISEQFIDELVAMGLPRHTAILIDLKRINLENGKATIQHFGKRKAYSNVCKLPF